jgi:protein-S-isoprenylcysteine O-methyltransferase Ste14
MHMALIGLLYGLLVYAFFLVTFIYAIGFVGDLRVLPKTIDIGSSGPLLTSLAIDAALLTLFALQHSVMARRGFKRWWTRIVPESIERSTFVLAATAVLALVMWQWRAIPAPVVWEITGPIRAIVLTGFWAGWAVLLISTFLINHFELFGLQQVVGHWIGRPLSTPQFRTPLFYRYLRHPIYAGFLLAFWATPRMSAGHLWFSLATTGYILVGIWFEERDLIAQFGNRYLAYREQVGMLLPRWRLHRRTETAGR